MQGVIACKLSPSAVPHFISTTPVSASFQAFATYKFVCEFDAGLPITEAFC
jgi:hypothetical protein